MTDTKERRERIATAVIERACADGRYHTILVKTKRHWVDISVSPSGRNMHINKHVAPAAKPRRSARPKCECGRNKPADQWHAGYCPLKVTILPPPPDDKEPT